MGPFAPWRESQVTCLQVESPCWGSGGLPRERHPHPRDFCRPCGCLAQPPLCRSVHSTRWCTQRIWKYPRTLLLLEFKGGTEESLRFTGNVSLEENPEACAAGWAVGGQALARTGLGRLWDTHSFKDQVQTEGDSFSRQQSLILKLEGADAVHGGENGESQTAGLGAPSPTVSSPIPSKQHQPTVEAQTENKKSYSKDTSLYRGWS